MPTGRQENVFITGAASGIARATARILASQGASVGICDRNADGAQQTADELSATGVRAAAAPADVCDLDSIRNAFAILEERLGAPTAVLACAGITGTTLLDSLSPERDALLFQINLLGVARTLAAALPGLRRAGGGWFGGVSSLVALRGLPFTAAYCGSKSAIAEYLEGVRPWLKAERIDLTIIYPGYVRTPLTDTGAVKPPMAALEPEQAAHHIVKSFVARDPVCAFPRGLAAALRLLRALPAPMYDRIMTRMSRKSPHLKY